MFSQSSFKRKPSPPPSTSTRPDHHTSPFHESEDEFDTADPAFQSPSISASHSRAASTDGHHGTPDQVRSLLEGLKTPLEVSLDDFHRLRTTHTQTPASHLSFGDLLCAVHPKASHLSLDHPGVAVSVLP
jgi:hypothetical protein